MVPRVKVARPSRSSRLIARTVLPGKPPGVEYTLTPLGHSLLAPIAALATWAQSHRGEVAAARARVSP